MNTLFDSVEVLDTKKEIQKENVSYEHALESDILHVHSL